MKEALTENDLRGAIRQTQEYLVQLLFAIGRSSLDDKEYSGAPIDDGLNQYKIGFKWVRGYGNALSIVADVSSGSGFDCKSLHIRGNTVESWGASLGRDTLRLLTMTESRAKSWDAQLQIATAVEIFLKGMLPRARWKNHYGDCQCSFHKFTASESYLLTEWGGRWLCDDCVRALSLAEPIYHRTGEDEKERTERDKVTPRLRWEILERDRFTCNSCGRSAPDVPLHVDHKIPIALGGKSVLENLHTLCADCNLGKSAKMPTQATLQFWEQVAA